MLDYTWVWFIAIRYTRKYFLIVISHSNNTNYEGNAICIQAIHSTSTEAQTDTQ